MALRAVLRPGAAALVLSIAAAAWAQDYTTSTTTGAYVSPPANAVQVLGTGLHDSGAAVTLPFDFTYFSRTYSTCWVCNNGFVQFGAANGSTGFQNTAFPLPASGAGGNGASLRGSVCPYWDDLCTSSGTVKSFTTGTAPDRVFVISFEGVSDNNTMTSNFSLQVQLHEGNGRIVFAYATGGTWPSQNATIGIDSVPGDSRYVEAPGVSNPNNNGRPAYDFQFDPHVTTFRGRVLYDRIVSDGTGIGNSTESSLALPGLRVEVRNASNETVGFGDCDANGDFSARGLALPSSESGALAVTAQGAACVVRNSPGGSVYALTIATAVPFSSDGDIGTVTIGASNDPGGGGREPLHVARVVQEAYDWARTRTSDPIPQLQIVYESTVAGTSYTKATASPPVVAGMHVSSAASNPDGWDAGILRKVYARHLLASIAGSPTTAADYRFDAVTDAENAFAEGFGCYLHAAISGSSQLIDGLSSNSATIRDLESPTLVSRKGDDVAGWVAAALYDLTDDANEAWDPVDGRGVAADRPFRVVDSLTGAVTCSRFLDAWGRAGYDGTGVSAIFIHYGVAADDDDEPNDTAAAATQLPQFGFRRTGRVLNLYNEDWYEFRIAQDVPLLTAYVVFDRNASNAQLTLEVRDVSGSVVATGAFTGTGGPMKAVTGPLAPGLYRLRIRHDGGSRIGSYAVEALAPMTVDAGNFTAWTAGRPFDKPIVVAGGVAPYSLTFVQGQGLTWPSGLVADAATLRVRGAPLVAGVYKVKLVVEDSADPVNRGGTMQDFTVNESLRSSLGEFLAFVVGKAHACPAAFTGGTAPFMHVATQGSLPPGVSISPVGFHLDGPPTAPGSFPFELEATDFAGDTEAGSTTGVVCVPPGTASLAAAKSACGFYFDAVEGTSATLSVKTAKKQPRRALRATLLGPDGSASVAAAVRSGVGKVSVTKLVCATTGRYFLVVASDQGDATQLVGAAATRPPRAGSGRADSFKSGDLIDVPVGALAGAKFTFKAKPDRKSGLVLRALYLRDPSGAIIQFRDGDVVTKHGAVSFTRSLPISGTWSVVIGAEPGHEGSMTYGFTLKQPKGVAYVFD